MFATRPGSDGQALFSPPRTRPDTFIRELTLSSPYRKPPTFFTSRPVTPPTPSPQYAKPPSSGLPLFSAPLSVTPGSPAPLPSARFDVRKPDDPTTFTLRNPFNGKVRRPTQDEFSEIRDHIPQCTGYQICGPTLVLQSPHPPVKTPLTVGGLPTIFVPDLRDYDDLGGLPGNPTLPNFGGSEFYVGEGLYPSFSLVESALKTLQTKLPNIVRLSWRYNHWVVGVSSSSFDPASYPGKFGNKSVVYTCPGQPKPHSRRLSPFTSIDGDNSDYRAFGLTPGIKVVGHEKATSSGVIVRKGVVERLTLAFHGFLDTDDVHHPDPLTQWKIGTIDITFPWLDISLCRLSEDLKYSNKTYFTANPPKRLVSSKFMDEHIGMGSWFEAEGFTCGRVHLYYRGPAVGFAYMPSYVRDAHRFTGRPYARQTEMEYLGPEVGEMQEGLCGAPVVHEASRDEEVDGVVPGFAWLMCGRDLIVASVDDIIDEGWEISDI